LLYPADIRVEASNEPLAVMYAMGSVKDPATYCYGEKDDACMAWKKTCVGAKLLTNLRFENACRRNGKNASDFDWL
jgi:hypothetical protein